jgi:hypothetical protein
LNSLILECPSCLTLFAAPAYKTRQVGERLWATRCRCGRAVEFDIHEMDWVQFRAQPHIANRMRQIENYRVEVEGLTYNNPGQQREQVG